MLRLHSIIVIIIFIYIISIITVIIIINGCVTNDNVRISTPEQSLIMFEYTYRKNVHCFLISNQCSIIFYRDIVVSESDSKDISSVYQESHDRPDILIIEPKRKIVRHSMVEFGVLKCLKGKTSKYSLDMSV